MIDIQQLRQSHISGLIDELRMKYPPSEEPTPAGEQEWKFVKICNEEFEFEANRVERKVSDVLQEGGSIWRIIDELDTGLNDKHFGISARIDQRKTDDKLAQDIEVLRAVIDYEELQSRCVGIDKNSDHLAQLKGWIQAEKYLKERLEFEKSIAPPLPKQKVEYTLHEQMLILHYLGLLKFKDLPQTKIAKLFGAIMNRSEEKIRQIMGNIAATGDVAKVEPKLSPKSNPKTIIAVKNLLEKIGIDQEVIKKMEEDLQEINKTKK